MSQATLLPTSPVAPSFPPLSYQGVPVLTTEMLAQAYEVDAISIRKNFSCNKERFAEGKHYFSITGKELNAFRLSVTESNSQISPKARFLTLWTERGAARHAKMLNSDKAWDMFELLEETFFRVVRQPLPQHEAPTPSQPILEVSESPSSVSPSTVADRKPLRTLICTWSQVSGQPFYICWNQLKAAFSLTDIRDLPQEWIPDAIAWVQARIDVLPAGKTAQALPVSPDREAALKDFFDRYDHELYKMEMQLCELDAGYSAHTRELVQEAAFRLSGGRNSIHIPLDFVIAALHHRQHQVKTTFRSLREDVWETRKVMLSLNRMLRA